MHTIDIAIILVFIAFALVSGLRNRGKASRNLEEYFLAGRTLSGWKAGLSMAATQFAADTPLLVTGIIAVSGIFALWQLWIYALAFLLMGFLLAPGWRRAGVLTDAEFSELRYGGRPAAVLRTVKALYFGTLFNCTVLAWVLFAAAKIAEPFLLWEAWLPAEVFAPVAGLMEWVGVPLTAGAADDPGNDPTVWTRSASNLISIAALLAVTAFYSVTGGLRGVVATDLLQFALMMAGTLAFTWIVVDKVGGLGAVTSRIFDLFGDGGPGGISPGQILAFTPGAAKDASFGLLALFSLQWLIQLNSDGTGYLAQRSMACRSDRDAKVAAVVFTYAQVLLRSLLWIPLGLGLLALFPPDAGLSGAMLQADREATYVRGMAELLPPGILGLVVTAMLAALASTVDTHINWGASYWTNDIYDRLICRGWLKREAGGRELVWVARASNLLILAIALLVMTQLTSINQAWQASLLLGAGMGTVLILRWVWWRVNAWAEIAAIGASVVLAPVLMMTVDDPATRLLAIAAGSTLAALAAIRLAGPETRDKLIHFHQKVRPAGFWHPIARDAGGGADAETTHDDGPRRLWRALGATFVCGFSVFCLLVGIGSWLAGSPPPVWFPWKLPWVGLLIALGCLLTPLWVRLGFSEADDIP
ncbi:MAG: Na+:solute symporter [SAR324 cluster bacterium]|nr:Na+:solute symporter [SAR324 cluster bacterium]